MVDFQIWYLHRILSEANGIIAQANRFIRGNRFLREDKEDAAVLELPHEEKPRKIMPSTHDTTRQPESPTKKSKGQVMASLPELGYLYKRDDGQPGAKWFIEEEKKQNSDPHFNAEKAGIRRCLIVAFKDEQSKQRDGIRFPPGVLVNKINHRVFNYDTIQDKITELVNKKELDCCDAVDIRLALKDKLFKLGEGILSLLTFPLKLPGDIQVDKEDLRETLQRFYRRDIGELQAERKKQNCGDCGGFRASMRWKQPSQQQSQQRNTGGGRRPFGRNQGRRY